MANEPRPTAFTDLRRGARAKIKEGLIHAAATREQECDAHRVNPNTYTPVKTSSAPMEQATIGRSLVIKGEISGAESLFVDGRIEGTVNIPEHRVTVGRNGVVTADVNAREVVIMGKVHGNIICSDRLDIRSEGSVTGDVVVQRISVEDGAILKGSVQVQAAEQKNKHHNSSPSLRTTNRQGAWPPSAGA